MQPFYAIDVLYPLGDQRLALAAEARIACIERGHWGSDVLAGAIEASRSLRHSRNLVTQRVSGRSKRLCVHEFVCNRQCKSEFAKGTNSKCRFEFQSPRAGSSCFHRASHETGVGERKRERLRSDRVRRGFPGSGGTAEYGMAAPDSAAVSAVLDANPTIAAVFGSSPDVYPLGEVGGAHAMAGRDAESSTFRERDSSTLSCRSRSVL
jgi:hypothetical protein